MSKHRYLNADLDVMPFGLTWSPISCFLQRLENAIHRAFFSKMAYCWNGISYLPLSNEFMFARTYHNWSYGPICWLAKRLVAYCATIISITERIMIISKSGGSNIDTGYEPEDTDRSDIGLRDP